MIKNAEAHAGEAHKLRELADAKNQAEALVYATEKSLKEHREKLDEAEASTIEGRIMELKQALDGDDARRDPRRRRRRCRRPRTSWPRRSTRRRPPRRPRRPATATPTRGPTTR